MQPNKISTYIKKIFSVLPHKKLLVVLSLFIKLFITLFILLKSWQISMYIDHNKKSEDAIVKIEKLYELCLNIPNIEHKYSHYFYSQQNEAENAVSTFYVANYHIWWPFLGEKFEDEDEAFYRNLLDNSFSPCSTLLKSDTKDLHKQLSGIKSTMIHRIVWFY